MDYMTALLERFRIETAQYRDAHCQTQAARETLREQLNAVICAVVLLISVVMIVRSTRVIRISGK